MCTTVYSIYKIMCLCTVISVYKTLYSMASLFPTSPLATHGKVVCDGKACSHVRCTVQQPDTDHHGAHEETEKGGYVYTHETPSLFFLPHLPP